MRSILLFALALAGCVAAPAAVVPDVATSPPASVTWTGCRPFSVLIPADAAAAEGDVPPGFRPAVKDAPAPATLLGFQLSVCDRVEGPDFASENVSIFGWSILVEPPEEHRDPQAANHIVGWWLTPDPALGALFAAWRTGGVGEASVEVVDVAPSAHEARIEAANATLAFHVRIPFTTPGLAPIDDAPGQVHRGFGVERATLLSVYEAEFLQEGRPPGTYTHAEYEVEGATGAYAAHARGRAGAFVTLEPAFHWEFRLIEIVEGGA